MSTDSEYKPHSHIPYGSDGSGFYSDNTKGCYDVIEEALPLVLKAASITATPKDSTFTIVDYGCADGGTSMPLMYALVKLLRENDEKMPIHIVYEDQPVNDFKSVFMRLQGLIPGPRSYLLDFKNIFMTASGTSFFSQCLPANSVTLGFSATAMHWLHDKPCDITGALHHTMISDPKEKELFARQAAIDWETILLHRAAELRPGCSMVLVQFAVDEEGQFLGNTKDTPVSMHHQMRDLWQGLVDDGTITKDEFLKTNFNNYYRTMSEYKKPFEDEDSAVRKAGLEIVSMKTGIVPCPYRQKWLKEKGDPSEFAKWYIPTLRTWSNSTYRSGLSDDRSDKEKDAIVDEFFRRYEADVATDPSRHGMNYVHCYMVIKKRSDL
ncbi:methyltransferase LUC1 [Nematostella vectensis]|uniref:methyltransferase LUC1 n=1 Tax=Nematostella vectensis TaxID=45351 RepID=UPI002076EA7D|nr:methyltransferase LUC1 [Nematostella vectensis]